MSPRRAAPPRRTRRLFTMHDARAILIGIGILTVAVGGIILISDVSPRQYPAILAWLVIALIVHDVLIAGLVFAVALAGRRIAGRIPTASIVIVQCALAVAAIVALIVVPAIVKKAYGTANASMLPLDYAANLTIFLVALTLATVAAVLLHSRLARRLGAGPPAAE